MARRLTFIINQRGGETVPKETVIVIAGIVVAFAAFALALGWASLYTRNYRAPRTESKNQLCGD